MIETIDRIGGAPIGQGETFHFECGPDLECFNACCRNKMLPLWPYDVLRLAGALETPSAEFLERYAVLEYDPRTGWPNLRLNLLENGDCPFITPGGCRVYADRPAACRIFPLARAAKTRPGGAPPEVAHIRQDTAGCLGWNRDREHTVETWTEDQDLALYNRANDLLLALFFHPRRRGPFNLDPARTHAVVAALYNPDVFREMIGRPEFRRRFGAVRVRDALAGDYALLLLGRDYLLDVLFGS